MDKLISISEAAKMIGVSKQALRRWKDEIPFFRVGPRKDRRYSVKDVQEYLKKDK